MTRTGLLVIAYLLALALGAALGAVAGAIGDVWLAESRATERATP